MSSSLKVEIINQEEIVKKSSPGQLNMVFKTSDAQNKSMVPGISHKHLQLPQSTVAQTVMKRSETFKFETKPSHTDTQNQQVLGDGLTKRKPEIGLLKVFSRDLSKDMKEGESQSPKSAIPSKEFEEKHTNLRSDWTLPPPKSLKFETTGKGSNRNASLKSITQSVVVKTPQKEENTNKKQTILAFKEDPDEYRQWVLTQAELVRFKRAKTGR
jgi:hypothetical protein